MKYQYFLVYTVLLLLISCSSKEPAIHLKPFEISLEIPKNYNQHGYKRIVIYQDKIIGFNFSCHCFDVYDLKQKIPEHQIEIDSLVRIFFNAGYAFNVVNDTIYLEGEQKDIHRMDFNGNIIDKISLANSDTDLKGYSPFRTMQINNNSLAISNNGNFYTCLYGSQHNHKSSSSFLKFNITTEKSSFIENSAINIDVDGYGFLAYPEITVTNSEKLIFSRLYTDSIYVYEKGKFEEIVLNSKVFNGTIDPHKEESLQSFTGFLKKAYRYENLVYLENLGYYARIIHSKKRDSQYDNSSQYLCIFNQQGEELATYKLDENIIPFINVWDDKLVLQKKIDQENPELLRFLCFPVPKDS